MFSDNDRVRFYIDGSGFFGRGAAVLLGVSVIFRLLGSFNLWSNKVYAAAQLILPAAACVLYILCLLLLGKKLFAASILPFSLAAVFFIVRATYFDNRLTMIISILAAVFALVLYAFTVIGSIRTKWLLPPVLALIFLYKVVMVDFPALCDVQNPLSFSDGIQELSSLCMILAMIFAGVGLKKRAVPEPELPKIEDPVIYTGTQAQEQPQPEEQPQEPAQDLFQEMPQEMPETGEASEEPAQEIGAEEKAEPELTDTQETNNDR